MFLILWSIWSSIKFLGSVISTGLHKVQSIIINQKRNILYYYIVKCKWFWTGYPRNHESVIVYLPSNTSKNFQTWMNQITPALEYGNWRPSATHNHLLWSSLYLWRHKQEVFSNWWNRIKNWTNIFLQKSMAYIWRMDKIKLDRSKKEKINYRWDKNRGLVASLEWFIFTSFSNSRFAADVVHLCKLSVCLAHEDVKRREKGHAIKLMAVKLHFRILTS